MQTCFTNCPVERFTSYLNYFNFSPPPKLSDCGKNLQKSAIVMKTAEEALSEAPPLCVVIGPFWRRSSDRDCDVWGGKYKTPQQAGGVRWGVHGHFTEQRSFTQTSHERWQTRRFSLTSASTARTRAGSWWRWGSRSTWCQLRDDGAAFRR